MKRFSFYFLAFFLCSSSLLPEEVLKVRPKEAREKPVSDLTQGNIDAQEEKIVSERYWRYHLTSLSMNLVTPLFQEVFPEKSFRAWGDFFSASFYLKELSPQAFLHLEVGAGASLMRISLNQPAVDFSHLYIFFPLRVRLLYEVSPRFFVEGFAGIVGRIWEYDSRDTPDGGFHRVTTDWLKADFGVGGGWFFNERFFGSLRFGLQYLSLGFGILL